MDIAQLYESTLCAVAALAALLLAQLIVADITGLRSQHLPGSTVETDHDKLLFRVTRTVANTNESIAIFVLAIVYCVLSGASPDYTAYGAWAFFLARLFYAFFYYSNLQLLRSVAFGVSLLSLLGLLAVGVLT